MTYKNSFQNRLSTLSSNTLKWSTLLMSGSLVFLSPHTQNNHSQESNRGLAAVSNQIEKLSQESAFRPDGFSWRQSGNTVLLRAELPTACAQRIRFTQKTLLSSEHPDRELIQDESENSEVNQIGVQITFITSPEMTSFSECLRLSQNDTKTTLFEKVRFKSDEPALAAFIDETDSYQPTEFKSTHLKKIITKITQFNCKNCNQGSRYQQFDELNALHSPLVLDILEQTLEKILSEDIDHARESARTIDDLSKIRNTLLKISESYASTQSSEEKKSSFALRISQHILLLNESAKEKIGHQNKTDQQVTRNVLFIEDNIRLAAQIENLSTEEKKRLLNEAKQFKNINRLKLISELKPDHNEIRSALQRSATRQPQIQFELQMSCSVARSPADFERCQQKYSEFQIQQELQWSLAQHYQQAMWMQNQMMFQSFQQPFGFQGPQYFGTMNNPGLMQGGMPYRSANTW